MQRFIIALPLLFILLCFQCPPPGNSSQADALTGTDSIVTGAERLDILLPKLKGKRVGLVVNHTSMCGPTHLADTLKQSGVMVTTIYAPEHGFRGTADAGEYIKDGIDSKLNVPVVSLYGNNKKPSAEQLSNVDIVIFDIQDVGARFFTYISTLHYVMEACAENGKKLIILDRPNPNGDYVDGPVLQPEHKSFVGMHPIPVVHGLTVGELGQMINEEGWLAKGNKCNLEVIPVKNWHHALPYAVPIKPSPNLPNDQSIRLYPSLCFFEGTVISVGRGTTMPFQIIGHPALKDMPFQFTPVSIAGMSKNPPFENQLCHGRDLRDEKISSGLSLKYLIDMYNAYPVKEKFFNNFFEKLAGTESLRQQIIKGMTEAEIKETWRADLEKYQTMRKKYLLYE